ncbi:unnamed protein product [Cunninghamella echinulata]
MTGATLAPPTTNGVSQKKHTEDFMVITLMFFLANKIKWSKYVPILKDRFHPYFFLTKRSNLVLWK